MNKRLILAQLFAEALSVYKNPEAISDAIWLISAGMGDEEDRWENFENLFEEVFGVTYEEAKNLNLF